jgi:hypothetical protein
VSNLPLCTKCGEETARHPARGREVVEERGAKNEEKQGIIPEIGELVEWSKEEKMKRMKL